MARTTPRTPPRAAPVVAVKENRHPNNSNFAAMKQIMRRKQLANVARKELDASWEAKKSRGVANEEDGGRAEAGGERPTTECGATNDDDGEPPVDDGESRSSDERDASGASSPWAMLGNHLNETTMDREENSAELASELAQISPARWEQQRHDLRSESLSSESNLGNTIGSSNGGISGVLSFLGESPLFDQTVAEEDEAERNLNRSAEKVKRLEEHLLRSATAGGEGVPSPVQPPRKVGNDDGDDDPVLATAGEENDREKEVTFAIQEGWETPRGGLPKQLFQISQVSLRGGRQGRDDDDSLVQAGREHGSAGESHERDRHCERRRGVGGCGRLAFPVEGYWER